MKNILLLIVVILTLYVVGDMYWWIKASTSIEGFENALAEYLSVFPSFIKDGRDATYLRLLMSGFAVGISVYMLIKEYYKAFSFVFIILSGLILAWSLFSLM